jgi:hypothetical protein
MLNKALFMAPMPPLQVRSWPPVPPYSGLDPDLRTFLALPLADQRQMLAALRNTPEHYGRVLHDGLATCCSYHYGYPDSPCCQRLDDALEVQLPQAELVLGNELLTYSLDPMPIPPRLTQADAAAYLHALAQHNPGVTHPLFDYLATAAPQPVLETVLYLEIMRNEFVDD